jgi:hypothetical protein
VPDVFFVLRSGDAEYRAFVEIDMGSLPELLTAGSAQQRKALVRKLVKEIRVVGRDEIVPTYRIPSLVRAPQGWVEGSGLEPPTSCLQRIGERKRFADVRKCTSEAD